MSDRAKGYLLKGKVKNAVSNWGDFINWYVTPAGLWGEYSYLPDVAMIAGIPGHEYSSKYQDWVQSDMSTYYNDWFLEYGDDLVVWCLRIYMKIGSQFRISCNKIRMLKIKALP